MAPSQHAPPPLPSTEPPPPPSSLHAPLHDLQLHDNDITTPLGGTITSVSPSAASKQAYSPTGYSRVSAPISSVAKTRPVSPPKQSAINEETDDSGVPRFRGYTNPSLQSRTFKILQEKVDAGEGMGKFLISWPYSPHSSRKGPC